MAINPNELRLGNLYLHKHGKGHTTREIDLEILANIFNPTDGELALDDFDEIPITDELLYRLGFTDRSDHRGEGQIFDLVNKDWKRSFCVAREYKKNGGGYYHMGTGRVKFTYIHQLQSLFFWITGFELNGAQAEKI